MGQCFQRTLSGMLDTNKQSQVEMHLARKLE